MKLKVLIDAVYDLGFGAAQAAEYDSKIAADDLPKKGEEAKVALVEFVEKEIDVAEWANRPPA